MRSKPVLALFTGLATAAVLAGAVEAADPSKPQLKTLPSLKLKPALQQQQQMKPAQTPKAKDLKPNSVQPQQIQPQQIQPQQVTPQQVRPGRPLQLACPDPAIVSFSVGRITSTPGPAPGNWPIYTIQLRAVLKNVGGGAYNTRPNQQAVAIIERGSRTRDVKYQPFGNLGVGAQVMVTAQIRNWRRSNEFPPNYEAHIRYDPDISIDGNPQNDDCRGANNKRTITGAQINAAIDALPTFGGASSMRR